MSQHLKRLRRPRLATALLLACGMTAMAAAVAGDIPAPASQAWEWTPKGSAAPLQITVRAEELPLLDATGKPDVTIYSTSYFAKGDAERPVMFLWNGGPGGASEGHHRNFGPRMVNAAPEDASKRVSSENPDSPLDIADLVFVDPLGTGFSRELQEGAAKAHWGSEEDARSAADFVQAWLKKNGRESSPVVLLGQSYAGVRVPLAAAMLLKAMPQLNLRGIVLVAPSPGGANFDVNDAIAVGKRAWRRCSANVAVYAQTAAAFGLGRYAGKDSAAIAADIEPYLAARDGFAEDDYPRVAEAIGLPLAMVADAKGCVPTGDFQKNLLQTRAERVGTADTRAHALLSLTETRTPPFNDPSTSVYTYDYDVNVAWEHYLRNEVGYSPKGKYIRLSMDANRGWNWTWPAAFGATTAPVIHSLLAAKPELKVLIAVGYYDLSVPYLEPLRVYEEAGLTAHPRFDVQRYDAGHAVHADQPSRVRSYADVRAIIKGGN